MTCQLTLTGNLVVGSDCGCSGGGAGPSKVQPMSLGCAAQSYQSIGSTDCPVSLNSPSEFLPLPGVAGSVSFLFIKSNAEVVLCWDGAPGIINGDTVLGNPTFTLGDDLIFAYVKNGVASTVTTTFPAGTMTLKQAADLINASAIGAGLDYLPVSMNATQTQLILSTKGKTADEIIEIIGPLAAIGLSATASDRAEPPTEVAVRGMFLCQFSTPVSGVRIKGIASVSVLAAV